MNMSSSHHITSHHITSHHITQSCLYEAILMLSPISKNRELSPEAEAYVEKPVEKMMGHNLPVQS